MRAVLGVLVAVVACGGSHGAAPDAGGPLPADASTIDAAADAAANDAAADAAANDAAADAAANDAAADAPANDATPDATAAPDATLDAATPDANPGPYTVGGTVHGLVGGSVTIDNDNIEQLTIAADGAFTFPTAWPAGTYYGVTVKALPSGPPQSCTVSNGSGTLAGTDIASIDVECAPAAPWAHVFAAGGKTCGIHADGSLFCWGTYVVPGFETQGIPTEIAPGTSWSTVSMHAWPLYGLQADGSLWRWDLYGIDPVDGGQQAFLSLATASQYVCAVRADHTLWCNGSVIPTALDPTAPMQQVGTDTDWATVSGAREFMIATKTDGSVWWWGENFFVDPVVDIAFAPVAAELSGVPWATVKTGGDGHLCGIRVDGTLWCWGEFDDGATGPAIDASLPVQIGTDDTWTKVATAACHSCAIRADHTLWCWGDDAFMGLGIPDSLLRLDPVQIGGANWTDVDVGDWSHTCGTHDDGSMECWGANSGGQLGTYPVDRGPTRVRSTQTFTQVATNLEDACAIASDGSLWCAAQFADPYSGVLAPVAPGMRWQSLHEGSFLSAIRADGTPWRIDHIGGALEVVQLSSNTWRELHLDWNQSCGLTTDGAHWCWATPNQEGDPGPAPIAPVLADNDTWLDVSDLGRCGIHSDGTLWCWPQNGGPASQIGTETYQQIVSTGRSVFVLRADGEIECVGNYCASEAPGATATHPALLVEPGPWQSVATSRGAGACGLKGNGTLWCWERTYDDPPTQVGTDTWHSVRSGYGAVRGDGSLWFWGTAFGEGNGDGVGYVPTRTAR